jgi:hypothetical protein
LLISFNHLVSYNNLPTRCCGTTGIADADEEDEVEAVEEEFGTAVLVALDFLLLELLLLLVPVLLISS